MSKEVLYTDLNRIQFIQTELSSLYSRKSKVLLDEIPNELQEVLNNFIIGRSIPTEQGKPAMYYGDFVDFYNFLWIRN